MFFNRVPSISTKELNENLDKKPMIIDVRTPAEYQIVHIKGAKNVPLEKIESFEPTQKVYLVCASGARSKRAAKRLKSKGYDVVNVKGGMRRWNGPTRGGKF